MYKTGVVSSIKTPSLSSLKSDYQNQLNNLSGQVVAARVIDIVLDENHPKFKNVGEWNGIGAIYYEFVNKVSTDSKYYALPYDSQLKTYPLINEIVLLIQLPNQLIGNNTSSKSYYYLKPLGVWNHPHHDAYPNLVTRNASNGITNDYTSIENGSARRIEDGSSDINLNSKTNPSQNTFVEKTNIKPLMPFMGDSLMEGRYGQSIRFGSTAKSQSEKKNNWSESGNNGDPITIIKNGQPEDVDDKGWIPITENLNKDLSSIYLTSKQKIPFGIANENFISYSTPPTTPALFTSPQIILNSDRIVINAKTDSILISGQKSVGLSSNESINLESKQIFMYGTDIRIGSKNPDQLQPALKGDDTVILLKKVITELLNLATALKTSQIFPSGVPTPDPVLNPVADVASNNLNVVLKQIDKITSNFVKIR